MQGRLNIFQKSMLQWNALHPYNAVHVVRVPGSPNPERLRRAICETIESRALTGLTLDPDQRTYSYSEGAADCDISQLPGGDSPRVSLAAEIERQLNTPFPLTGPFSPFRFFVVPGPDAFYLGLAYLHAVADAESIVLLIKEIFESYTGDATQTRRPSPRSQAGQQGNLLFSHPGVFARKLAAFPRLIRNLRRSCRPPYRDARDFHNGFRLLAVEPKILRRLVGAAKVWGVTVNDVLLALLLKSCAQLSRRRAPAGRRNKFSVGCIVNTRKDFAAETRGNFGVSLGSFMVTHSVPPQMTLPELVRDVARLTSEIKRKRLYLATSLELAFGRFMLSFFPPERQKKLYSKNYPLWGGLTNMNLNALWPAPEAGEGIDYIRGVSTGPTTPLVLSFTTTGSAANLGLTYRSTVFSADDLEHLTNWLLDDLANLEVAA